jgi:4-oxalocrotonate tautomerase
MPVVQITLLKGRSIEQKRKVAARVTDALVEDAGAKREAITVTFVEVTKEDYASGGTLLADR